MKTKVSDLVARFFSQKGVKHAFGIIGSANSHLFDSIFNQSSIELVCNHHEQACTMAVQTYWKITGRPTFALVTAGAGSSNAITGVLSAWADSIPCLILSGQENRRYISPDHALRMYGIQGYDSPFAVSKITKYSVRVMDPCRILYELEKAWHLATSGRPGPCWVDLPMDLQAAMVEEDELEHFQPEVLSGPVPLTGTKLAAEIKRALEYLATAERPLLWLGVGIRMAGAETETRELVARLGVPALLSWSCADLLSSDDPLCVGRAGTYGQRSANLILQNCDYLLTIGTRLAIPQVGYEIHELARAAKNITVVDIDPTELGKYPQRINHPIHADAGEFVRTSLSALSPVLPVRPEVWLKHCQGVRSRLAWIGPEHEDRGGFINSYRFMEKLGLHLKSDQVIVTDMGTALLCSHQALALTPPQRLLTSQGLGEMGFGLPGAIGASFARNRGEVLCLNCDGGMMMNLQELQTMVHHHLPIKLFIFSNDGYLMIKHTQKAILQGRYSGTDRQSGVSCPDFSKLAVAFDLPSWQIRTWADFDRVVPLAQAHPGPCIVEIFMHPEQYFHPKLSVMKQEDGTLVSPPLEDLSPLLPLEKLRAEMLVGLHPKSKNLAR